MRIFGLKTKKSDQKTNDYGAVSAVLVTLSIYLGSQILGGTIISIYGLLRNFSVEQTIAWIEKSILAQFWYVLAVEVISLIFLYLFVQSRRITYRDIGLIKPTIKNFAYAVPAYIAYFVVLIAAVTFIGIFVPSINLDQDQQVGFETATGFYLPLVFISLVILPAIVEEILVRGFLYSGLKKKLPVIKAALLTSLIFGVAHLQLGDGAPPLWVAAIDTFVLSMALIWLREKTGNIWAGVAVHFFKNSLAFMALFLLV